MVRTARSAGGHDDVEARREGGVDVVAVVVGCFGGIAEHTVDSAGAVDILVA